MDATGDDESTRRCGRSPIFSLEGERMAFGKDFLTKDRHVARRFDAKPNVVSIDFDHRHDNAVVNDNPFVDFTAEDEHRAVS